MEKPDDLLTVLQSDAAAQMMPGFAFSAPVEAPGDAAAASPSAVDMELLLTGLARALRRVKHHPGTGDFLFVQELKGARIGALSPADCARLLQLGHRYRAQLPPGLRVAAPPGETAS